MSSATGETDLSEMSVGATGFDETGLGKAGLGKAGVMGKLA